MHELASEDGTPDTNNKAYYENGNIPFVKIEDTENKYITDTQVYITQEGVNHSSAWLIKPNCIIFTNGATIGNVAINKIPATTKQGILGIIPSKIVSTEFLYYLLINSNIQNEVHSREAKGTFAAITLKNMNEIKCFVPKSLIEQNNISSLFNALDSLVALHQRKR